MNTTAKGDAFEEKAYRLIEQAVQSGQLGILPQSSRVFKKKKYYSRDRETDIIFDLAIEVWLPGAPTYSFLFIIECKSYSHPVPVNDVEEFYAKIAQVAGVNVKGVFITDSTFQEGAFKYARAKGMMLLETSSEGYTIRLPKKARPAAPHAEEDPLEIALQVHLFLANLFAPATEQVPGLRYWSAAALENRAVALLGNYKPSLLKEYRPVDLSGFLSHLEATYGVRVETTMLLGHDAQGNDILGEFDVAASVIYITPAIRDTPRFAFVLAHELGHFFLHRELHLSQQLYDSFRDSAYNVALGRHELTNPKHWIEWQANQFAAALLLPEDALRVHLIAYQIHLGISRNRGTIYCDHQPVNREDYRSTLNYLAQRFGVSRTVIKYRLHALHIIVRPGHARWVRQGR
ncbi:ImmA/IrrE family metallo-endopeptidase [Hymenobacter fodinae]|uniref:ImmA/IrrE family metallo-endopeptidase n=1 Tax=Hymenobacter fodinae TaxID=2510796 RepID=A0A4Z0P360_9BACT|nr:ImmA/IrrE family metallo-endopeptidase [Hymenobacter fodinae]TGE06095.1 ImmA/IrrE family metallo-endopeptidase [Hymenobacter fodinae]